jgi:hypothetical protein
LSDLVQRVETKLNVWPGLYKKKVI